MTTIHRLSELRLPTLSLLHLTGVFKTWSGKLQERRKRARLRAILYGLQDRELKDIGVTRSEIEYVALNPSIDPRGKRYPG
jgi:uncharacterized protein YjiS (DUF1127 family)